MARGTKVSPERWRICRLAWELSSAVTFGAIAWELMVSRQSVYARAEREGWRSDLRGDASIFTYLAVQGPAHEPDVDGESIENGPSDPVARLTQVADSLRGELEMVEALLLIERIRGRCLRWPSRSRAKGQRIVPALALPPHVPA